eukprot:GFYU01008958.1.p1 GENE.GFYU01008958.1~~GFYU01008958.1.p1  ORF type:complete len:318 (+),score=58.64 GFYU01008958.1:150-1103(+)
MTQVASAVQALEDLIGEDPGQRGIGPLRVAGDLANSCQDILKAKRVAVGTGFFIDAAGNCETDGPLGAAAVAKAVVALGKECVVLTDNMNGPVVEAVFNSAGLTKDKVPRYYTRWETKQDIDNDKEAFVKEVTELFKPQGKTAIDHIVTVELAGHAADGISYNMRGEPKKQSTLSFICEYVRDGQIPGVSATSTGIGDGGNEVGMGKMVDQVRAHVNHGERIACTVSCDHLLASGVSNWGAYGLVYALYATAKGVDGSKDLSSMLHTAEDEEKFLKASLDAGAVDGPSRSAKMCVDGFPLEHIQQNVIGRMRTAVGL